MFCRGLARRVKIAKNVSFEVSRMFYAPKWPKLWFWFLARKFKNSVNIQSSLCSQCCIMRLFEGFSNTVRRGRASSRSPSDVLRRKWLLRKWRRAGDKFNAFELLLFFEKKKSFIFTAIFRMNEWPNYHSGSCVMLIFRSRILTIDCMTNN